MSRLIAKLFLMLAAVAAFGARAEIIDIDNAQLAKLAAEGVPLIDIRTRPEWEETGVIAKSHLLTFFDEKGGADPALWLQRARAIAKPGEALIVICRSGNRTNAVSQFLTQQAGYARVYNVKNGIRAWAKEGRPLTPAAPLIAACRAARTC